MTGLVVAGVAVAAAGVSAAGWIEATVLRRWQLRRRAEASRARLDDALARRVNEALALAASGRLAPLDAVALTDAAHEARAAGEGSRARLEGLLSGVVRHVTTCGVDAAEDPDLGGLGGLVDPSTADLAAADVLVALASADHDETLATARRHLARVPARWLPSWTPLPPAAPPGARVREAPDRSP